jgi:predicted transcriptional regulator
MAGGGTDPEKERGDDSRRRAELISALDHPVRRQILRLILDRGRISPVEIAKELDMPLGGLSYHVRILCDRHAVEPAGTRRVRGAIQHFYETAIEGDPPIEALLEETREADEACAEKVRRKPRKRGKRK